MRLLLPLLAGLLTLLGNAPPKLSAQSDLFVSRAETRLVLAGRPFRFGGANIEWLGLEGYGPADPRGPRLPSHYEIDDAMATARELGARVVRSQTMGDSVGCNECLEPALGQFNQAAFERVDYALKSARDHGLRIIATIVGDDARAGGTGCVYLAWRGITVPNCSLLAMDPFWTDPAVIDDVEQHIRALLEHVNVYTRVAYKNDPTILGWDLMNGGGSPPAWTRTIAQFVQSIDHRHLVLSDASNARLSSVDACVAFVYPHWRERRMVGPLLPGHHDASQHRGRHGRSRSAHPASRFRDSRHPTATARDPARADHHRGLGASVLGGIGWGEGLQRAARRRPARPLDDGLHPMRDRPRRRLPHPPTRVVPRHPIQPRR